jgi:hypothetical protein
VLLAASRDIEVFKRAHLVALASMNENTLKVWLRFINEAARRQTAARVNTKFTTIEAMSVVLMGELQKEWGTPPEHSYTFAWHACFAFCEAKQNDLKRPLLGFPRETFTVSFSPGRRQEKPLWYRARGTGRRDRQCPSARMFDRDGDTGRGDQ